IRMHPAHLRDGWVNSKVAEDNYKDSLEIMEALKKRHGGDIDFLAPDTVPTGPASNAFAPVEGVVIAAPTGVAAWNINGVTLHSCLLLPVVNKSYGKACDLPLPNGPHLASLRAIWAKVVALFVDEMSFVSAFMLDRLDQHLRLAKDTPRLPFGGLHIIFAGDLYQLPPPGGLPAFASRLWLLFELCELQGNQRAAKDPTWAALLARVRVGNWTEADIQTLRGMVVKKHGSKRPAPKAVNLYATRKAVADSNDKYKAEHLQSSGATLHDCPAVDINVKTGAPLDPAAIWTDPEDTGGLETLLQLSVGLRVMLRHNIDVEDGLVNGACGTVEHIDIDETSGETQRIWVAFEKNAGTIWRAEHGTNSVAILRRSGTYVDKDCSKAERRQFPLVLAKAITIHKSQAATMHHGVHARLDHTVTQEGQAYVALSRCPEQALCTLEHFNPKALRFNKNAEWALHKLKFQQAKRDGPPLWCTLFKPPQSKEVYSKMRRKVSDRGAAPNAVRKFP
ncbi:pif1, partial [Symbiodinium necroappetens]